MREWKDEGLQGTVTNKLSLVKTAAWPCHLPGQCNLFCLHTNHHFFCCFLGSRDLYSVCKCEIWEPATEAQRQCWILGSLAGLQIDQQWDQEVQASDSGVCGYGDWMRAVSAFLYVNLCSQMCIYVICNMWTCIYMCVPTENTCLGPECYNLDLEYGTCQTDRFGISHCVLKYRKYLKHVIWRVFKTKLHFIDKVNINHLGFINSYSIT